MPRPRKVKLPEPTRSTDKDLFPHEPTFTYRIALRIKKNTPGTTVAWFSCKEHAHKYIERYTQPKDPSPLLKHSVKHQTPLMIDTITCYTIRMVHKQHSMIG